MPIILNDFEQGDPEWHEARRGVITATGMPNMLTPTGKPSASLNKYVAELAAEIIVGSEEGYKGEWMDRGNRLEIEARALYEFNNDMDVEQVGFVYKDESRAVGASPDGLVGNDGGLEIKCPKLTTHMTYLMNDSVPPEYVWQVHGNIYVAEREWWDFMSYHPKAPPLLIRVERNEVMMVKLDAACDQAIKKLNTLMEKMKCHT